MMKARITAGFGRGTIRFPQEMFPTEGFCAVHDDPHARLMVLKTEGDGFALLALELVICPKDMVSVWRERIGAEFGLPAEKVWVHVNHTITTPHEPGPKGPPGKRSAPTAEDERKKALYRQAVEAGVSEAIDSAKADLTPAKLGWGAGECRVNGNRDVETPFGWWVGPAGDGPSNHTMNALRADGMDGGIKGIVLFYGLKPCAIDNSGMEENTRLVSSEVTGMACLALEERFGAPVLFCMTAAGDQVPVKQSLLDVVTEEGEAHQRDEGPERGIAYAGELGCQMAADAALIVGKIVCGESGGVTAWGHVSFPWQKRRGGGRRKLMKTLEHVPEGETEVTAELFRLDDAALAAAKPEINCATEADLMRRSPFDRTILITMVNGDMKYMPDRLSFERGTWEAQSAMLMPGAAEKLVEAASEELRKMKEGTESQR